MKQKELVPKRRFIEFQGIWKQVKLGELFDIKSGYAFNRNEYVKSGVPIINGESIHYGRIHDENLNYLPKSYIEKYSNFTIESADIVLGLNRPIINNKLKIAKIPMKFKKSLLYQRAGKVVNLADLNIDFSYYLLGNEVFKFVLKEAVGSDQPFISTTKLKDWFLCIPESEKEQQKIGECFKHLDEMISLQQRKVDKTKALKSAYLAEMFPAEGESIPKRRFEGFTEEWEKWDVSEIGSSYYGGGTPKTIKKEYWDGDIPWIQSSDINEEILYLSEPKSSITEEGLKNSATRLIPANSIAVVTRVGVGKLALIPYGYTTSQDFLSISNLNIDSQFGTYVMYKLLQKEKSAVQGTSIKGLTKDSLLSMKIMITNDVEEQQKIGSLFKKLDDIITNYQQKLKKLKATKQAYLHEMFV